jgi:glucose/mannose-6-phosphate isomerase
MDDLSREAVGEVDAADQVSDILEMPTHLHDALWRVESAGLRAMETRGGMVVAGMGGSAIGGMLARAALGDRLVRPFDLARSYELPSWATQDAVILCASYSGDTEETLACYEAAAAVGAPRIVVTTGGQLAEHARADGVPVIPVPSGLQPRAAVAYMTVAALEVAALSGASESIRTEVDVAAAQADELCAEWGPDGPADSTAKVLARELHDTVPVIAGAGLTAPVAYRWKTQINENAKAPAFSHELPELDHNELQGWAGARQLGRFSAVFLDDSDLHPRVRRRIALSKDLIGDRATTVQRVQTRGTTRMARVISLVLLGDLVSLYLAVLRGVDPTPVEVIDRLKAALPEI